jgi:hypothetical protein
MSTRTRSRPAARSATARPRQRAAEPTWEWPDWLNLPAVFAIGALVAELGHLSAAVVEWPAAPARGLFHVLTAAALGAIAVTVYFGSTGPVLIAGITLTLVPPAAWLTGALLGMSPYGDFPPLAALGLTMTEIALAGVLSVEAVR